MVKSLFLIEVVSREVGTIPRAAIVSRRFQPERGVGRSWGVGKKKYRTARSRVENRREFDRSIGGSSL